MTALPATDTKRPVPSGHTGVSVVIPTFNRHQKVADAIQSALGQTLPPLEIVVVDDASQPPLSLDDLGCSDPRIRLVRLHENSGPAVARQAGIAAANGDVIAFLDSDDVWLPEKLSVQLPLLAATGDAALVAVTCGWQYVFDDGRPAHDQMPIPSADPNDFARGCWFNPGSTVILRKAAFITVGGFNPHLRRSEDLDWFLRFALAGGQLQVAPIIGATIAVRRARGRGPISEALDRRLLILEPLSRMWPDTQTKPLLRSLNAYLYLEIAAAAREEKAWLSMLWFLARSFAMAPRRTLSLRRWWLTP